MPVIERVFWWPTLVCAILLFPSWLHPKTHRMYPGTIEIQGWGWQNVASWTGGLVILLLLAGYALRPRVVSPSVCALLAAGLVLWPYPKHRRCAKCAYDMAALPGLTCPECGRAHPNERSLLRRGRPWRRAARMIGIGILLSYACYAIPRILTRGLPGVIPSTALMLAAPWLDPGQRFPSPTGHPGLAMPRRLGDELLARLKDPQRWRWQSVLFTRACAALSTPPDRSFALRPAAWPECWLDHAFESCDSLWALDPFLRSTIETHLRIRRRWPAGRPLFATHDFQSLGSRSHGTIAVRVREGGTQLGGSEGSRDTYLGQLSPGLHALEIEVAVLRYVSADAAERVTAWSATRKATVEIVPSVDDMLRRCSTDPPGRELCRCRRSFRFWATCRRRPRTHAVATRPRAFIRARTSSAPVASPVAAQHARSSIAMCNRHASSRSSPER